MLHQNPCFYCGESGLLTGELVRTPFLRFLMVDLSLLSQYNSITRFAICISRSLLFERQRFPEKTMARKTNPKKAASGEAKAKPEKAPRAKRATKAKRAPKAPKESKKKVQASETVEKAAEEAE